MWCDGSQSGTWNKFTQYVIYFNTYHFSMGIQRRRSVPGQYQDIARAISWESGLLMTLIPSQLKKMMHFDSLY